MGTQVVNQEILERLDSIKEERDYIKEHMVDVDTMMAKQEENHHEEALREYREGKTTSLEDVEKEFEL